MTFQAKLKDKHGSNNFGKKYNLVKEKTDRRKNEMTTSGQVKKGSVELVINLDMWITFAKNKQIKRANVRLLKSSSKKKKFSSLLLAMLQIVKQKHGIKFISDVLFVPDISQSLLSVGQML
ncbi:hypothetical protein EPI10_031743 [Gossypium australe]|uniref:Uncharacterized protein n=1 Tax=Gossypium australe TaxID=47621 RepID=A0A5B6X496_9ROSI|nr:hypothetical protein EPI10_031743 [Gossypium australe]